MVEPTHELTSALATGNTADVMSAAMTPSRQTIPCQVAASLSEPSFSELGSSTDELSAYQPPSLRCLGSLVQLTRSGGLSEPDFGSFLAPLGG